MYAKDHAYVVAQEEDEERGSALGGAVITIVLAITLALSFFAVIGGVALFLI